MEIKLPRRLVTLAAIHDPKLPKKNRRLAATLANITAFSRRRDAGVRNCWSDREFGYRGAWRVAFFIARTRLIRAVASFGTEPKHPR